MKHLRQEAAYKEQVFFATGDFAKNTTSPEFQNESQAK